jgi:hypothetical protein
VAAEAPPAVPEAAVADRAAVVVGAAVPTAAVEAITASFHHDRNNNAGDANRIPGFFFRGWFSGCPVLAVCARAGLSFRSPIS